MYAVIETGGKQYKVALGDRLKVEKIIADEGASVKLEKVLMIADGDKVTVGSPVVGDPVTATVVSHGKAKKIEVFKMKRRKNYRRTQGHRQQYTELEITAIGSTKAEPKSKVATKKTTAKNDADTPKASSPKATATTAKAVKQDKPQDKAAAKLTALDGLGVAMEKKLQSAGVSTLDELADLNDKSIAELAEKLGMKSTEKIEKWVEQAKQLVA